MYTVFISYAHPDTAVAESIESVLSDLGIKYFRDVKRINWGESITPKVREALDTCVAVLVIVSAASLKSHWVPYEIGHAAALRKLILPFLVDTSLEVPHYIRDLSYTSTLDQVRDYFTYSFHRLASSVPTPIDRLGVGPAQIELTELQLKYLLEISRPRNEGSIYGEIDEHTGRDVAPYQEAIETFQDYELMQFRGSQYKLTEKGWRLADQLWAFRVLDALDLHQFKDQKVLAEEVDLTDGESEMDELKRHVAALQEQELVKIDITHHGWSVRLLEKGLTARKHRRIEL